MSASDAKLPPAISTPPSSDKHKQHCFIVMPYGRDAEEQRWYRGWLKSVIEPTVRDSGYDPILAASEDKPNAITDEIREHLVYDKMVIVDLGGRTPQDKPNPNVMYELGLRHAFGAPLVIMAWEGQYIPFDVMSQRALKQQRDLHDLESNRSKLRAFVESAKKGEYYKPMDAVKRWAMIESASGATSQDALLKTLLAEIRIMRGEISTINSRQDELSRKVSLGTATTSIYGGLVQKDLSTKPITLVDLAKMDWLPGDEPIIASSLSSEEIRSSSLNLNLGDIDVETLADGTKLIKLKPSKPDSGGKQPGP